MTITEEKILNGIRYFVRNTKNVGRTKLFKLLFAWDILHFYRYGKSVTGFDYYTYDFGPVPKDLFDNINTNILPDYLKQNLSIIDDDREDEDDGFKRFKVILKETKINYNCFSPNEKSALEEIACIYKYATAKEMTQISHLKNSPWDITVREKGMYQLIDYFLIIDENAPLEKEEIEERFRLHRELLADGRI